MANVYKIKEMVRNNTKSTSSTWTNKPK